MKIKERDKLPDAKVFILDKDPKEVSIKLIIGDEKTIVFRVCSDFYSLTLNAKLISNGNEQCCKSTSLLRKVSLVRIQYGSPYPIEFPLYLNEN